MTRGRCPPPCQAPSRVRGRGGQRRHSVFLWRRRGTGKKKWGREVRLLTIGGCASERSCRPMAARAATGLVTNPVVQRALSIHSSPPFCSLSCASE